MRAEPIPHAVIASPRVAIATGSLVSGELIIAKRDAIQIAL
jgi:hypothetical protein